MGAKNHGIVMPDANIVVVLNALVAAGFGAAGQRCMALRNVIFVGDATRCVVCPYKFFMFSKFNIHSNYYHLLGLSLAVEEEQKENLYSDHTVRIILLFFNKNPTYYEKLIVVLCFDLLGVLKWHAIFIVHHYGSKGNQSTQRVLKWATGD
uniref:methylmalonate-semialdehyde dehydrogenase (CoA acylating) n=1 Tax=Lactuca sativa TaxID=4236 RepID=A0A9R1USD4_LACSA|nr:hypothetical protein LSAT_V11C800402500 [Lactuca sativa]